MVKIVKEKDAFFKPLVKRLPKWVRPNQLTFIRFLLIPVVVVLGLQQRFELIVVVVLIGFFLDGLDGTLARVRNQNTQFGAVMDPLADKGLFLTAILIVGIYTIPISIITLLLATELTIVIGGFFFYAIFQMFGLKRGIGANVYGKIKATFQVIALFLLGFFHDLSIIVDIAIVLLLVSVVFHFISMLKHMAFEKNTD